MERKLIDYLPPFIRSFNEMAAVMDTEQPEFDSAWQNVEDALADQFVETATINGVKRREEIFGIVPKANDTLEERRFVILSKINEQPPYTMATLEYVLKTLCGVKGYALRLNHKEYELNIKLALENEKNVEAIVELLGKILPANISWTVGLFNTHEILSGFTHEQLSQFTHDEIRKNILV